MRAQCTICSDLYDGEADIAAIVTCGHTFHDGCLSQWLNQSKTCPQCRKLVRKKGVINKLYFDQVEEDVNDPNTPSKLHNQLSSLKASLFEKDRERITLVEFTETLNVELNKLKIANAKLDQAYKTEKTSHLSLQREIKGFQQQKQKATDAIEEAAQLRNKLESLTTMQAVVRGLECDVEEMISTQGNVKTLATWCAVLKKELLNKKTDCKKYKEQHDRMNKENMMRKRDLIDKTRALASFRDQFKHSEEDLKHAEKQIESLKKKLIHLQKAVESPTNTASSFAHRLINESPAPQPLKKKPRLSSLQYRTGHGGADLNITPDLFSDVDKTPSPVPSKLLAPNLTQAVRISTAAQCHVRSTAPPHVTDISHVLPLNMNIFKSKGDSKSGFIKKGYNGMGGHEKFVNPFARPSTFAKKPARLSAKMRNLGPAPTLPTLTMDGL